MPFIYFKYFIEIKLFGKTYKPHFIQVQTFEPLFLVPLIIYVTKTLQKKKIDKTTTASSLRYRSI